MKMGHYILKNKKPVIEKDLLTWAKWFEDIKNRRVALTKIGEWSISTVFLGLDHNFTIKGKPLLFETMVFPGDDTNRYHTWKEAEEGHKKMIKKYTKK